MLTCRQPSAQGTESAASATQIINLLGSPDKTRQRQRERAQQEYDLLCWGFPTDGSSPEALVHPVTEQETAP